MGGKYRLKEKFFKTNRKKDGGTIKIFADDINPLLTFKTFLLSIDDSVRWIVKEMLEKCGLKHEHADNFTLIQIIIPARDQAKCETIKQTILRHDDCPFQLWLNYLQTHQNPTNCGSMIFKLIRVGDSTIDEDLPMLIEVDSDGNNLPMPRLLKIRLNRTLVGRQEKNSFFKIDGIGIDRDHCTLQKQNGIVALIPRGETYYNGKQIKTPVILQHDSCIRFGSNVFFRFYDPLTLKRNSIDKTMYNSLPTLSTIDENQRSRVNVLPGLLDVSVQVESTFLRTIFNSYPLSQISFRLSPVYSLYMALRYRLSSWVNPHLSFVEKQENVSRFLTRIEETIDETLEDCHNHIGYVTYWLANLSELLFFVKHDRQIEKFTEDFQKRLVERLQHLFYHLIDLLQNEIEKYASALINNDSMRSLNDEIISIDENLFETHWNWLKISRTQSHSMTMKNLFSILSSLMTLLRKCRVNAALTIQIFSHLFLSINTWLFNRIVCSTELNLCSNESALKMTSHLITLRQWTEKQGLELIFDHHLTKVNQLLTFLISPKRHFLIDSSWKINSLQMKTILDKYQLDSNETPMSKTFSQALLKNIEEQIDEKLREEGFPIELVEDRNIRLPFVFPDDGYTCEHLQGIPHGLLEFIDKYIRIIPCRVYLHPASLGYWTEFFSATHSNEIHGDHSQRLETIKLMKKENSLGLSIVAAKGEYQSCQGIYVREIVENGPAKLDGRLELGDQLLAVDKMSLIDVTQEEAAEILRKCGSSVTLQVLKNAALHQGILSLISRPIEQSYEPMRSVTPTSLSKQPERLLTSPINRSKSVSQRKSNERPSIVLFDSNPPKQYQSQPNLPLNRERSPPLITREDIPTTSMQKQSIHLVTSPPARPIRSTPLRVVSSIREKPRSAKLGVKREQRLHDLIIKFDRTTDEDKELKRLKLEEEFQRRFGQIQTLLNDDQQQKVSSGSLIDETKEFDERLKRRLEQFERERAMERVYLSQMLSKRQTDIERRLRLDRERAMRADRDIEEFHNRHLKEEEQILEAKKEQARLLKHMHLSKAREEEYKSMIDSTVTHEIIGTSPSRKN